MYHNQSINPPYLSQCITINQIPLTCTIHQINQSIPLTCTMYHNQSINLPSLHNVSQSINQSPLPAQCITINQSNPPYLYKVSQSINPLTCTMHRNQSNPPHLHNVSQSPCWTFWYSCTCPRTSSHVVARHICVLGLISFLSDGVKTTCSVLAFY